MARHRGGRDRCCGGGRCADRGPDKRQARGYTGYDLGAYLHPAQTAAAQRQLCDTYKLVAHAVPVDTNGSDKALARITLTNAAAILDNAAADPALDAKHRDAARASDRLLHNDRNGEWWHSS